MNEAKQIWKSIGDSLESQLATRGDGIWFKRDRLRDPRYGWNWSKWTATSIRPTLGPYSETCSGWLQAYQTTFRLPRI